ncbi:MAG TPA: carboxypeptidase regulatory-like domain-containing protein [Terriglobales bacterium]|nr:carboxypeptidase regulatory-like domain-containing protein [Terriglobales bacterium]
MKHFAALLFFVCFPFFQAGAQSTAQIAGTIQDPSGAAIAGAQVQITNVDTNAVRTTESSATGAYVFPNLEIGPYRLQVTLEGFTTYAQSGIVLQVNSNPEINVTLQVGALTQTVEVQANAAMVETQSTGVGQVIQPEQVVDLPLNGRQVAQLIALSGAAVSMGRSDNLEYPNAPSYSIAGSQGNTTNYYLDGSLDMDYRINFGEAMPFPDALQEFKVESSAVPASLGIHPGGSVNTAVKSGTNAFHGDAFDYLRNTVLDAYPGAYVQSNGKVSAAIPDNLKRNQFGGTIGGPIVKNKLFFFYGYQGTRERVAGTTQTIQVPTQATLNGDFSAMIPCGFGGGNPINNTYATAPGSNKIQPQFLQTPSALIAQKLIPFLPPPTDACGTATYNVLTADDENQSVIRTDWQRTQNDSLFIRYFVTNYTLFPSFTNNDVMTAVDPGLFDRVQTVAIGDTHIISPQMTSSLRLAFLRTSTVRKAAHGIPTWSQFGAKVTSQISDFTGSNSISGYFSPTAPDFPGYDYENTFEISETVAWAFHAHQMTFGFSGVHVQMNDDGLFQVNPNFTFSGSVTGDPLADFLTGNPSTFKQGNGQLGREAQNMPSLFFQDNWKATRRFQLNLGLRWDPFIPQYTKYKQASDFSLAGYEAGTVSSVYPNAPPGTTFPGDSGFHGKSDTNPRIWDFAPRIGLVWDPRGTGKETIRAGYGVFYDTSVLWNTMHIVLNPPWGLTTSVTPLTAQAGGGLANPWSGVPGGNPFPSPLNPPSSFVFQPNGQYVFENQNIKPNNVQQWNVSFQKQIGASWLVSASYLGSKTTHAWLGRNLSPSVVISQGMTSTNFPAIVDTSRMSGITGPCTLYYGGMALANEVTFNPCNGKGTTGFSSTTYGACPPPATPCGISVTDNNARRLLTLQNPIAGPLFAGGITQDFSDGNATYNGVLLSAEHRFNQNFSMLANFTWSHCLDQGEIGEDIGNAFQDPANRRANWGNCNADRRRVFNLSLVAQSPKHKQRILQALLGYWQGSGIFTASSGSPLNITDAEDVSLTGVRADRPVEIGNPFATGNFAANPGCVGPAAVKTVIHWFNPCAFMTAPLGQYGTLGRNALVGPGNWNFDAAIWRTFPISERFRLDFRAEAFNAFNHLEIGNPGAGIFAGNLNLANPNQTGRSKSAGLITSSSNDPRIMQLALKLTF